MQNIHLKKIRGECVSRRNGQPLGTARRKCREWVTNSVESVVCVSLRHVSSSRPPDHSRNRCLSAIYTHTHTHTHTSRLLARLQTWRAAKGPYFQPSLSVCVSLTGTSLYTRFPDNHFPGQTFPGQDVSRKDVSRTRRFPYKTFPGQSLSRTDVSRTSYT